MVCHETGQFLRPLPWLGIVEARTALLKGGGQEQDVPTFPKMQNGQAILPPSSDQPSTKPSLRQSLQSPTQPFISCYSTML